MNDIILERLERNDFLHDYYVLYTRFLLTQNFDIIRLDLIDLISKYKMDACKAISLYLQNEDVKNWDNEIVELAQKIENKQGAKTPEEWEVIASLHYRDRVNLFISGKEEIDNTQKLMSDLKFQMNYFDLIEDERDHGRRVDPQTRIKYEKSEFEEHLYHIFRKLQWTSDYINTDCDFTKALKNAIIGYGLRCKKFEDSLDYEKVMEFMDRPFNLFFDKSVREKTGIDLARYYIDKQIKKKLKKKENRKDMFDEFAYAVACNYSDGNIPITEIISLNSIRKRKLYPIAEQELIIERKKENEQE